MPKPPAQPQSTPASAPAAAPATAADPLAAVKRLDPAPATDLPTAAGTSNVELAAPASAPAEPADVREAPACPAVPPADLPAPVEPPAWRLLADARLRVGGMVHAFKAGKVFREALYGATIKEELEAQGAKLVQHKE